MIIIPSQLAELLESITCNISSNYYKAITLVVNIQEIQNNTKNRHQMIHDLILDADGNI